METALSPHRELILLLRFRSFLCGSHGASGEARTPDRSLTRRLLFQLSYKSIWKRVERTGKRLLPPCAREFCLVRRVSTVYFFGSLFGTRKGTRTPDPLLRRQLLYPAELCGHMATIAGLEPATSGVTGRRSNHLNYMAILCDKLYRHKPMMVMPAGFEPAVSSLRGWRPEPIRRRHHMVLQSGVEPPTRGFSIRCSTC